MARRIGVASLLCLSIAACQTGDPAHCRMARSTDLPFVRFRGHLFIDATLNGATTRLILDTGAQTTTISAAAAARLKLSLEPGGYDMGVGGTRSAYLFYAKTFQIGRLRGRQLQLRANDMDLGSGETGADGLLGDNFLAAYDVDLDLPEHKAILFTALDGCSRAAAALTGSLYSLPMVTAADPNQHGPMVRVEIEGKTLTAMIDSGATNTLIFRNAARRIGLDLDSLKSDRHFRTSGIGPRQVDAARHVMTPVTVGDLTIQNLPAAIVDQRSFDDADMLLGLDFLTRVHVWLSFSSHTLIMQYPPLASPPAGP